MNTFSYMLGCRDCLNSSPHEHVFVILDSEAEKFQKGTEYEAMKRVEELRRQNNNTCVYCNSQNVEILDISLNGYPLYDFEELVRKCQSKNSTLSDSSMFFMINIDKQNGRLTLNTGGSPKIRKEALQSSLGFIIEMIQGQPDNYYKIHQNGNFFISLTGEYNFQVRSDLTFIQRFRTVGLSKVEVLEQIKTFAMEQNIQIPEREFEIKSEKKPWWNIF